MDAGFEACGVVVGIPHSTENKKDNGLQLGQPVGTLQFGGFSEYSLVSSKQCFKVPEIRPEVVALLTSGLTASIALEQAARIKSDDTVLITAAAGGTGQFFVQLASAAGAHVIATCGSQEKVKMLQQLGASTVINYKTEDLKHVLKTKYPNGVSLILESVGGSFFNIALNALRPGGRLVIIGAMSQYGSGWKPSVLQGIPEKLLAKNQSLIGFFLMNHARHFKRHFTKLISLCKQNKLHVALDTEAFSGIEHVYDAVDRLQSGRSMGKVVVQLQSLFTPKL